MSRSKDLTFTLSERRITLDLWSSDFTHFTIPNKVIRTTLDNTVADIKEIISIRSARAGGELNPRAIKIIYRNRERQPYTPLSDFLEHVDYNESLRVEFDLDSLGSRDTRPTMMNLVIKLSSGKKINTRETLDATIRSLIETIVDHTDLRAVDIEHLEFNGGQVITDIDQSLGNLLQLDTAPLGELNLYVKKVTDFLVKLSSPDENIIRTNKFHAGLDTTVLILKNFIIDQYTGTAQITEADIKIIYFGRILSETSTLNEISPYTTENITLHFVIKEPEPVLASGGFWRDLQRGSLFEFLPREPNPNFDAEVQRDERLRQQLRSGSVVDAPAESVLVQEISVPNSTSVHIPDVEPTRTISSGVTTHGPPALPDGVQLTGTAIEVASMNGIPLHIDQVQASSTVYKITIETSQGQREVTLSSSQVIINDSEPDDPYLMLSPSGFAKLSSLGVTIEKPQIVIEDEPSIRVNHVGAQPLPQQGIFDANRQAAPLAQNPPHVAVPGANAFGLQPRNVELDGLNLLMLISFVFKCVLVYFFILSEITDMYLKILTGLGFFIYAITRQENRNLIGHFFNLLPQNIRNFIVSLNIFRVRLVRESVGDLTLNLIDKLLLLTEETPGRGAVIQFVLDRFVDLTLFFTSFFMPLHNRFLMLLNQRTRRQEEERREQERLHAQEAEYDENGDHITPIPQERGSTGAQPRAEL